MDHMPRVDYFAPAFPNMYDFILNLLVIIVCSNFDMPRAIFE